ncbi:MAG: hypothetical protein WBD95_15020 [Xanthobacteraceae bacterium]
MVETIGIDDVAALAASCRNVPAARDDHGDLTSNQVGCQRRQPINLTLRPTVFDRHVPPFDIAGLTQAIAERLHKMFNCARRRAVEEPNHRLRRLLRPRSQRPCDCHAAERGYELPFSDVDCH